MKSFIVKKTFGIIVSSDFLKSDNRDKLIEQLYAIGASKVKRVGSSDRQTIYISFIEEHRKDCELQSLIDDIVINFSLSKRLI